VFKPINVTSFKARAMKVFDFDHDFIDDVVIIDEEGKKIVIA